MSNLTTILENPCWFPYEFDASFDNISFVLTNSTALRSAPFLDQRFIKPNLELREISVRDISGHVAKRNLGKLPMIFHSAFCCSTLMATALDRPGTCLSLKEPQILMSLANAKRMLRSQNRPEIDYKNRFEIVMKLLSRRFATDEHILLKPTNSVNNLLEDVLGSGFPVILMYASLEDFLVSVLKKGEACKSFIRTQYNIFTLDPCVLATIPARQAMTFTDLQIATLVWRHQLELFFKAKNAHSGVMALRDINFLANKADILTEASEVLNLGFSNEVIKEISEGMVFTRNSKFSEQEMDGTQRDQDAKAIRERYAEELAFTLNWAKTVRLETDVLV